MRKTWMIGLAGLAVAACGSGDAPETEAAAPDEAETATESAGETAAADEQRTDHGGTLPIRPVGCTHEHAT